MHIKFFARVNGLLIALFYLSIMPVLAQKTLWQIGAADNNSSGMALSPSGYQQFLAHDFGWEDRFYLVGYSSPENDWPYILPGPKDRWGGTAPTAGIRSHQLNILFGIGKLETAGEWKLVIDLAGYNQKVPPLFQVTVNDQSWLFPLPPGQDSSAITAASPASVEHIIAIPIPGKSFKAGGNRVRLTSLDGSWLVFDQVKLESPTSVELKEPADIFIREVAAADYELLLNKKRFQPLLVDLEHLAGKPTLTVRLDGDTVFNSKVDSGRYQFEVPMPAITRSAQSHYEILSGKQVLDSGTVNRGPQRMASLPDYVDTKLGTAHSRWMIAPGPWMPFSMVKISPDNQNDGWQAGYDPTFESVGAFSHIHEWTMAGLGMLPVNGPLKIKVGDQRDLSGDGYRSRIDKLTEQAPLGYYSVVLTDYNIKAELTATTRASFQRYTYPRGMDSRVMIDLKIPAEYGYQLKEVSLKKVSDYRIEGHSHQYSPNTWSGGVSQDYIVHFVIEFDQPIRKMGVWQNDDIKDDMVLNAADARDAGAFVEFDTRSNPSVQVRTGISFVSIEGASKNLEEEISKPCGWSFDKVRGTNTAAWSQLFERVRITTNDRREKMRFYTNMYRALCSRNTFSDVDGHWRDAEEKIQQFSQPGDVALGCDAFWNTF